MAMVYSDQMIEIAVIKERPSVPFPGQCLHRPLASITYAIYMITFRAMKVTKLQRANMSLSGVTNEMARSMIEVGLVGLLFCLPLTWSSSSHQTIEAA